MRFVSLSSRLLRPRWAAPLLLLGSLTAQAATVEVLSAGEGDKQTVRMAPKAGTAETFSIVLDMDMKMDMGEMGQIPTDLPPLAMDIGATVDQVDANGDIHYSYELKEIRVEGGSEVEPMMRAALEKQLPTMKGASGKHVVSNRGVVLKSDFKPPEGANPQQVTNMHKGMNHASAAFPEEAIGVGAKWRVTQKVKDNGLELDQTVVYTLKERKGNKLVLVTELIQKPGPDAKIDSGVPGAEAELLRFQSMGDGETTIDLAHLFPTEGTMKHYLNSLMTVNQPTGKMAVGVEMDMNMTMKRQ